MTYMEEQAFTKKTYTFQGHEYSKWVVEPMGDYTRVRFFEKMGGQWVVLSDEDYSNELAKEEFGI